MSEIIVQLKKEIEFIKSKVLGILDKKNTFSIDEYELYLYLSEDKQIEIPVTEMQISRKERTYPELPESDQD